MKKWDIKNELSDRGELMDLLLKNRGVESKAGRELFLNPPRVEELSKDLSPEFQKSISKAKKKILNVVKSNTPLVIHGDYDADGICATSLLYNVIKKELGYDNCIAFIPNRFDHGYGLSNDSIDAVKLRIEEKFGKFEGALLITVDSGITSLNEVEYAKTLGFDVIITDHHQKPSQIPDTDVIVWNDEIVATSIAWFLGRALGSLDKRSISLAATATITDVQPVLGLNRSIVKEGIDILNNNPPLGFKKLLEVSGKRRGDVSTYELGWVLGPRLNAAGRIMDAKDAVILLTTQTEKTAEKVAKRLNQVNFDRQEKTVQMYELAIIDEEDIPKIIVTVNEGYHEGIIGLVASRLVQKYFRPAVVISLDEKQGKGSVRSIPGVDIISMLREFDDLFESLGGHPGAAGFTIKKDKIEVLEKKLIKFANKAIDDDILTPVLEVDLKIPLEMVDSDFISEVEKLKPFGLGNYEPVFVSEKVGVTAKDLVGKEKNHVTLKLESGSKAYRAIYFNGLKRFEDVEIGEEIDIAYAARSNKYQGSEYVDIVVRDLTSA
jgi:single-stranded-DNA-specific exonuclease